MYRYMFAAKWETVCDDHYLILLCVIATPRHGSCIGMYYTEFFYLRYTIAVSTMGKHAIKNHHLT